MDRRRFGVLLVGMAGAVASCGADEMGSNELPSVALKVSAATSLKAVMERIQVAYEQENPDVAVTYNFGASGTLAQQIAQGAQVDVFISAAPSWMDVLAEDGLLLEISQRDLLENSLVVVVPSSDDAALSTMFAFEALKSDRFKKIAVGEPESVPVGSYAREALQSTGLFDALQPKLVLGRDSAQVLIYVAGGEVDAGIVYATDAEKTDGVQLLAEIEGGVHSPIVYPVAVVDRSKNSAAAQAFVDFLFSEVAAEIFLAGGFELAK